MLTSNVKKFLSLIVIVLAVFAGLNFAAWYRKTNTPAVSLDFVMDTFVEQKFYGENAPEVVGEISQNLRQFEKSFSMHLNDSQISILNQNAGVESVQLSDEVFGLLAKSAEFSRKSLGAFDVTIAPLTKLWNITGENPKVPSKEEILQAKSLVNVENLILDEENHTAFLKEKGMAVDLGGIAKGAACDIVREAAGKYGVKVGYASIGGNLVVLDEKPLGKDFYFGVRDPLGNSESSVCALTLYGKTMATTGTYERFFEENDRIYHHILDPQTAYPAESDLLSVTVISRDGALADFLSTTLFVLGEDFILDCLDREDFQIIAITDDKSVYCSKSLENQLVFTENNNSYNFIYGKDNG